MFVIRAYHGLSPFVAWTTKHIWWTRAVFLSILMLVWLPVLFCVQSSGNLFPVSKNIRCCEMNFSYSIFNRNSRLESIDICGRTLDGIDKEIGCLSFLKELNKRGVSSTYQTLVSLGVFFYSSKREPRLLTSFIMRHIPVSTSVNC